jgi:hypothetical protein
MSAKRLHGRERLYSDDKAHNKPCNGNDSKRLIADDVALPDELIPFEPPAKEIPADAADKNSLVASFFKE